MADFPTGIFAPRTTENLPGITYEPTKTKTSFAEDYSLPAAEIVAVEETLGENPQGASSTVSDRIAVLESRPTGGMAQPWFLS